MKNQLFLTILAITAGLLTACSSDDESTPGGESPSPDNTLRHISVQVSELPLVPDAAQTRADISTIETLTSFEMHCIYNNSTRDYSAKKSGNDWTVDPNTWPDYDARIPFYAHSGGTFVKGDANYISFTTDEDAFNQHDLLVASSTVAYSDRNGKVPLTFSHACAAVRFHVLMTKTLRESLGSTELIVKSIMLRNVYRSGEYVFNSGWRNVGTSTYYTLTNSEINIGTESQALATNYLFLIPQSPTNTYLEVSYKLGNSETVKTATIPLTTEWEAGKEYNINIKLGTTLIEI